MLIIVSYNCLCNCFIQGIFLSFSMTFVIVAKPAPCTCGITRFFLGFCYTLCYAAIVTKTNRIARIFNQRRLKPCQKPKYTSPKSQLVITAFLVSVEGEDDIFYDYIIYLGVLLLTNFISPQNLINRNTNYFISMYSIVYENISSS